MTKYIESDAVVKEQKRFLGYIDDDLVFRLELAVSRIPAADVRPVKRGKWENAGSDVWKCSRCGYGIMPWNAGVNFCPNCGADMRDDADV